MAGVDDIRQVGVNGPANCANGGDGCVAAVAAVVGRAATAAMASAVNGHVVVGRT